MERVPDDQPGSEGSSAVGGGRGGKLVTAEGSSEGRGTGEGFEGRWGRAGVARGGKGQEGRGRREGESLSANKGRSRILLAGGERVYHSATSGSEPERGTG